MKYSHKPLRFPGQKHIDVGRHRSGSSDISFPYLHLHINRVKYLSGKSTITVEQVIVRCTQSKHIILSISIKHQNSNQEQWCFSGTAFGLDAN